MSETVNPVITVEMLRDEGACDGQVEDFIRLFGDQVEVTEGTAIEHAAVFDWSWAADTLLHRPGQVKYRAAMTAAHKAFYKAAAPIRERRYQALTVAEDEYNATVTAEQENGPLDKSAAWIKYREASDAAATEHREAQEPLYRTLNEAQARAFAHAYRAQHAKKVG